MEAKLTYIDAFNELQQIVQEIEKGDVGVDDLSAKIKRASQLIQVCKAKLTASEEEVKLLLDKLQDQTKEEE